ncbi:MAG: hypothetical protein RL499_1142, partial [Actinomycetota bacterium]
RRARQERAIDIVGDPAGHLFELTGPGEDFNDTAREVLDERPRVGKVCRRRGLEVKELFVGNSSTRSAASRCITDDGGDHGGGGGHGLLLHP